jgi:hypothetical protein
MNENQSILEELSSLEELSEEEKAALNGPEDEISDALKKKIGLIQMGQKLMLDLELQTGRYISFDVMEAFARALPEKMCKGLKNAANANLVRGRALDMARLRSIQQEHQRFPGRPRPRVAIEGGGPTGLLLALTQYEAGADVTLFEKRSELYERSQIVRLDPKWMARLKYYLGEEYYKVFSDEGHKAIIREDGFGEIATMDLEAILNLRLIEMKSMLTPDQMADLDPKSWRKV